MQGFPPPARRSGLLPWILHGSARPWSASFAGAERMFLLRPPQLFRVRRDLVPALEAAAAGVGHVVLLSLQGRTQPAGAPPGGRGPPTRLADGLDLYPATYFLQNRSTTHAPEVRERDELWVPAGKGRTALVDARDVAARAHTVRSHEARPAS